MAPVIISGLLQGFGLGCTFVPLNIIALSTLPRHILTQGTAIRSLMRNLGGSIGISVLVANLATRTPRSCIRAWSRICGRTIRWRRRRFCAAPFSLSTPSGIAALNAEVTRQAAMVAYIDRFQADDGGRAGCPAAAAADPQPAAAISPRRRASPPPPPRPAPTTEPSARDPARQPRFPPPQPEVGYCRRSGKFCSKSAASKSLNCFRTD